MNIEALHFLETKISSIKKKEYVCFSKNLLIDVFGSLKNARRWIINNRGVILWERFGIVKIIKKPE